MLNRVLKEPTVSSRDDHLANANRIAAERDRCQAMTDGTWDLVGLGCFLVAILILTGVL